VSIQLFTHPFSSYCQKVLIALYENGTLFEELRLDPKHPKNGAELGKLWPIGKFPVIRDGDRVVIEATSIIDYLDVHYRGATRFIPDDADAAIEVRMLDRIFDNYVMTPMQKLVGDAIREPDRRDPTGVAIARGLLDKSYAWIEDRLGGKEWIAGEFSLADCAAGPSLFYADWAHPIPEAHTNLRAYRTRLLARPSFARAVDEARPYRNLFPLGAPDRD
jgi:glutathione S-transferase